MKKASIDDMEIGNILFGNSRGEYAVEPRGDYQEAFCDLLFRNRFDGKWYKYPLRDAYSNQDIDIESFKAVLRRCEESMKGEQK